MVRFAWGESFVQRSECFLDSKTMRKGRWDFPNSAFHMLLQNLKYKFTCPHPRDPRLFPDALSTPSTTVFLFKFFIERREKRRWTVTMMRWWYFKGLMDEMKMKNILQEEPFWERWGGDDSHNMDIWNRNFWKVLHDWNRGSVIFRRIAARKICAEKLTLPYFEKKIIAPRKGKICTKKGDKYSSSEIPKKIEAHHIAQLYDRLKQTILVLSLSSGSLFHVCWRPTPASGVLLLLPPALSPAAVLTPASESVATLPPFGPIEGQKRFDQISSQWESQKNRFALIYFGKIQLLPPCIWNLPFMSYRLWRSASALPAEVWSADPVTHLLPSEKSSTAL
jgi:hypothetical protein